MDAMAGGSLTLGEIVARLGGELSGNADIRIVRVATLQSAGPGEIAFLTHGRYRAQLDSTGASAVIVGKADSKATALPHIVASNPYLYFARLAQLFSPMPPVAPGTHPSATVAADAIVSPRAQISAHVYVGQGVVIGDDAVIGPGCFIGDQARIDSQTRLGPNVSIYHRCSLGKRVIVHAGAVIGADGFGMAMENDKWLKIPQTGRVLIGDDVEIGANTTIDRGALDDTVIEDGVKLDNQIQIGHNVHIGAHSAFAGCVGVAGSARIGRHCTVGGGAIILGHIEIADHVHISAATLVTKSITMPGNYGGAFPFSEQRKWLRNAAELRHLADLAERVERLEAQAVDRSTTRKSRATRAGQSRSTAHKKTRED
jgi:UDP-3-O-[3-hydroxymyristoyl] glucosamine N-acyltransferase